MSGNEFYTFRQYMRDQDVLSPSSEDYIEMIYRLSVNTGFTRVGDLAAALNIQPPSVTKMIKKLDTLNLIKYEKYGVIMLKPDGMEVGKALLNRHNLIEHFLEFLNVKGGLLEETEKIEHTINEEVLQGIAELMGFFEENPGLLKSFNEYQHTKKQK